MTSRTQKIISCILISIVVVGGFEALIYILNLNQPAIYLQVAFWIFVYLMFNIVLLFDLHFKKRGSWTRAKFKHRDIASKVGRQSRVLFSAFWDRVEHLRSWQYLRQWLHFLLLPGFIFWATVSLLFINLGFYQIQQTLVLLSSLALILDYWYLKEAFHRQKEVVDSDIFVVLTVVKIYAAALLYGASLAWIRYYCLSSLYFSLEVFCFTFLLIYQALYQHRRVNIRTMATTLVISLVMALIGQLVYEHWGFNYFTAAIFMTACYNLFWGVFHYQLDGTLTLRALFEILLISLLVAGMVVSITNFRARILNDCDAYSVGSG